MSLGATTPYFTNEAHVAAHDAVTTAQAHPEVTRALVIEIDSGTSDGPSVEGRHGVPL